MYKSLGYARYGSHFHDPVFGLKITILWVVGDLEMLRERRSPMLEICKVYGDDSAARGWYRQNILPAEIDHNFTSDSAIADHLPSSSQGNSDEH
jgi:hypothetical protein